MQHSRPDPLSPAPWWRTSVVYQVYPRSFAESVARPGPQPGVGTLAGLTERLPHLAWLGVDAVWLSPIFRSPMADFGYDVADYCAIDPLFGTMADFDEMLATAHALGLRVLLDWVPNHTSDQHPWFRESRRDRTNPKADWYVWRDEPANNWLASFPRGESAWSYDEQRGQWHLRCFLHQQPDLNWDNPDVEAAMLATLRFWLDKGVDGFRMDVVHLIGKDLAKNDPPECVEHNWGHIVYNDEAVTHERLHRIQGVLDEYDGDRLSVGEVYLLDEAAMADYLGTPDAPELNLSFNFRFLWTPWRAAELRDRIRRTIEVLRERGAWPTWVLSNHDVPRHRQRFGGDEAEARMAALLLLTLPGTPFLYQGEELGLVDADVPPERVVDPGLRDGCRAPVPWSPDPLHGWAADPWLPFPPEADTRNVARQRDDPDSILHWYRQLLALRRTSPVLHSAGLGTDEFTLLDSHADVLAWARSDGQETWLSVLHTGSAPAPVPLAAVGAEVVASTDPTLVGTVLTEHLAPAVATLARRGGSMGAWVAPSQS